MGQWGPSVDFYGWVQVLLWIFSLVTVGVYEQDFVVPLEKSFMSLSKQPVPILMADGIFFSCTFIKNVISE